MMSVLRIREAFSAILSILSRAMRFNGEPRWFMIHPILWTTLSLALILLLRRKGAVNHSASLVKGAKCTFMTATRPKQAFRPLH